MATELPRPQTPPKPRSCGACSACCFVIGVQAIEKPQRQNCPNQRKGCGCVKFEADDRPRECSLYHCLWIEGLGQRRHRPDRLGLIFDVPDALGTSSIYEGIPTLACKEVRPGAMSEKHASRYLKRLQQRNAIILVYYGGEKKLSGPKVYVEKIVARTQARDASMAASSESSES